MAPHYSHHDGAATKSHLELWCLPRCGGQRRLVFQCNAAGQVDIDMLSEHDRVDYLFARALRGRDYSLEIVTALDA